MSKERLWISPEWAIPVDANGYVRGECYEGAFGCVIALEPRNPLRGRIALKFPKLNHDTVRDNGFVASVVSEEIDNIEAIAGAGPPECLIPIAGGVASQPLRGSVQLSQVIAPEAEGSAQHGHVFFVSFEKGKKPRFLLVRLAEGQKSLSERLSVHPKEARAAIEPFLSDDVWKAMANAAVRGAPEFRSLSYCLVDEQPHRVVVGKASVECAEVSPAMNPVSTWRCWFAGVPSVVFPWAPRTLQQDLSSGALCKWSMTDIYDLFDRTSGGLYELHKNGRIHGDLRPANLLAGESVDPIARFLIADYGSFCNSGPRAIATDSTSKGNTIAGPAVAAARTSPFYAPERRTGIERETADVAIVSSGLTGNRYGICLGWRRDVVDASSGQVVKAVREALADFVKEIANVAAKGATQPNSLGRRHSDESIRQGDRIRVRDYVFEVEASRSVVLERPDASGRMHFALFACPPRYARVLNDRLTILDDTRIADQTVIPLSSYFELWQWSAATDVFGLGALSLYCVFSSQMQAAAIPDAGTKRGPASPSGDGGAVVVDEREIVVRFGEMMRILESVPYFCSFWSELAKFYTEIQSIVSSGPAVFANDVGAESRASASARIQQLREFAQKAVHNLVQSAPNVRIVLGRFGWNMAHFLLFMRFVLACLHRRDHLPAPSADQAPFCESRAERPSSDGGVLRARKAIVELRGWLSRSELFSHFVCQPDVIPEFDPRSDGEIRIQNNELRRLLQATCDDGPFRRPGRAQAREFLRQFKGGESGADGRAEEA